MILDNLKFRALENGFTIKYHVTRTHPGPVSKERAENIQRQSGALEAESPPPGFGGEIYVRDIAELKEWVLRLIDKHTAP